MLYHLENSDASNTYFDYLKMPCHVIKFKIKLLNEDMKKRKKELRR